MVRKIHESNGHSRRSDGSVEWENLVSSVSETRERFDRWYETLEEKVRERPGAAIAAAMGTGFILNGGLFTGLTLRIVRVTLKLAVRAALAAGAVQALSRAAEPPPARRVLDVSSV